MQLDDLQLEHQADGYIVQRNGHHLQAHLGQHSSEWHCSCGFVATDGDSFDDLHMLLRTGAERQELINVAHQFLRKKVGPGELRAAVRMLDRDK